MSKEQETQAETPLCEKCGSLKLKDDKGSWYCPKCIGEIDWGLEE